MPAALVAIGAVLFAATPVYAQVDLNASLSAPTNYTPGDTGTYSITVTNVGDTLEDDVTVTTSFPAGATVTAASCASTGTGTVCDDTVSAGQLATASNSIAATSGSITWTLTVAFASSLTADPLNVSATVDSSVAGQDSTPSDSSALQLVSDLSVTKTASAMTYTPGTSVSGQYSVVVANAGPSDASGVTLTDNAPAGATIDSWSCTPVADCQVNSGSGNISQAIAPDSGVTLTYSIDVSFASSATADPLSNIATLTVPGDLNDPDSADQSASADLDRVPVTDLQLAFDTGQPTGYVPGGATVDVSWIVTNAGPTDSADALMPLLWGPEVDETAGVKDVTWACSPLSACSVVDAAGGGSGNNTVGAGSGVGNEFVEVTLASGTSVTLSATIEFASSARADYNLSPSINPAFEAPAPNPDPNTANNSETLTLTVDRRADIQVTKTASASVVNPGASFVYTIEIENLGPSDLGPDPQSPGSEIGLTLTDLFQADLLGDLSECADPSQPCWRACTGDNGETGNYDPDSAANCPTAIISAGGNIEDLPFNLAAGSTTLVRAFARTETTASGSIFNSASIALDPTGDVVENTAGGGADQDEVTLTIDLSSDLSVTKTDGVTAAVAGDPHEYTIVVRNNGFIASNNVSVSDMFPMFDEAEFAIGNPSAGFEADSVTWECRAFDGACCQTNSANCGIGSPITSGTTTEALAAAIDLPGQSRVEYTVSGTIDPRASGTLDNTATISPPMGMGDPDPANNTSQDNDTVLVRQAELLVVKTNPALASVNGDDLPPFALTYRIEVENLGPSFVPGVTVSDPLTDAAFDNSTATWMCEVATDPGQTACPAGSSSPVNGVLNAQVDLDPGGKVAFTVMVETTAVATGQVTNTVQATLPAGDVYSDSLTTSLIGRAELTIVKTDNRASIAPGEQVDYLIRVSNEGPDDVFGANVIDEFPLVIDSLTWSCQATTPVPGDVAPLLPLPSGFAAGDAVVATDDGRHVYVVGTADGRLYAYDRTNVPGANFGAITLLETEINGIDDSGDSGPVVAGMSAPFDIAISPEGTNLYVLTLDAVDGPSLSAFSRATNPAAPNFGEVTFLGSVSAGLPTTPAALVATSGHVYVAGSGDPDGADMNTDALVSIFERDGVSGLPLFDINLLADVPGAPEALTTDPAGSYLFVGGADLAMFTIDPAQAGQPAGRLTFADRTALDAGTLDIVVAEDAPQLYVRSITGGGAGMLSMVAYLDMNDDPALVEIFDYDQATMTLPAVVTADPLVGAGGIAVAPDGEHVVGVDADQSVLFVFRRDPISGGLSFQEARASSGSSVDPNRGLIGAADVVFAADGRHVLVAASAAAENTNPPLAAFTRQAPDPLFAFIENDRNGDPGISGLLAPNDVATAGPDHVYTISLPDNTLTRFDRFPRLGLTPDSLGQHLQFAERYVEGINGISGLVQPRRLLVSPDGASIFVTSEQENTIAVFSRETDDMSPAYGELTLLQVVEQGVGGVDGISGAQGMAMDPASNHLYVAGSFGASIARFERNGDGTLTFRERVVSGSDGVAGLSGIRDLVVAGNGSQVLGVSTLSNALVVFDRETDSGADDFGQLTFVQALQTSIGTRPVSLAVAGDSGAAPGAHVYVVSQNSDTLAVLRRVTDPTSSAFGQVQPVQLLTSGSDGIGFMNGPSDVRVSPDGKRVYVAAEFSDAVLVFDRDLNASSSLFGTANLVETRRDTVRGVDGIRQVRALAVSIDSRDVYAAGFGDGAIASFRLGTGSLCTAGGSGSINDLADIGVGGTIEYRASGIVRPGATGVLSNTATVSVPVNFVAEMPQAGCPGGADYCATDTTTLIPEGSVSIDKVAEQVSVIAGGIAEYTVTINNAGPSSLVHDPGTPLTVSDPLDSNPAFVPGSAVWSCEASGSGSLEFLDAQFDLVPGMPPTGGPFDDLVGVTGLALVPGSPGNWLVSSSVLDDALSVFTRDAVTGELLAQTTIRTGDTLNGQPVDFLDGAQSVAVSNDGAFIYVASRVSDSISVLSLADDGMGAPQLGFVQTLSGLSGLDQAVHVALSQDADQTSVYVAGSNDDAIAVFQREPTSGMLTWVQSVQQGDGGTLTGLLDVGHILVSQDGQHVYALSPTEGSVALFNRDAISGMLTWRQSYDGMDFGVGLAGATAADLDQDGRFMYVAAETDNRIVVLERDLSGTSTEGSLVLSSSLTQGEDGVNGLVGPRDVRLTGDGVHVYVTAQAGSSLSWFIRDEEAGGLTYGGLRGSQGSSTVGLGGATGLIVDDSLDQIFVAGTAAGAISRFQRQADSFCPASGTGELIDVEFNIGAGGTVTFSIAVEVRGDATGDSNGLVTNVATLNAAADPLNPVQDSGDTSIVSTEADLVISKDDGLSEFDGLDGAIRIAGTNTHIYTAAPDDNALGVFSRNVDPGNPGHGDLAFEQVVRSGEDGAEGINGVVDLVVSADQSHIYTASPLENAVVGFERDALDGTLAFLDIEQNGVFGVNGLSGVSAVAMSPDGEHLYAAGSFANAVASFDRQADDTLPGFGELSFLEFDQNGVAGVGGTGAPVALAVSPDGRHVYVLGEEEDTISVFLRNRVATSSNFGRLEYQAHYTNNTGGVTGLAGVQDLAISSDGVYVYVLGTDAGTLARFTRDAASGELTFVDFKQDGFGTPTTSGLTGARSLLLDDVGTSLYVAGAASATIVRFDIDPGGDPLQFAGRISNGDPAPITGGDVFGLDGVSGLYQTPDADHVYAASAGRSAVVALQASASPSALDFQQILIDGLGGVAPGVTVQYVIRVENLGPSDVPQARVVDQFPDSFDSVSWECSAVAMSGAMCAPGTFPGDVDVVIDLPVGGRATILATGVISPAATGRLVNTATISAIGVQDPVQGNNSATDDDTVLSPSSDLVVDVDNGTTESVPGGTTRYDISIDNLGPSAVRGAVVEDLFPAALFDAAWSCTAVPAPGILAAPISAATAGYAAEGLAISGDQRSAYVVGGDAVEVFQRDPLTGSVVATQLLAQGVNGVFGIRGASDILVSSDGRFVYVAGSDSDAIALFERDGPTGELEFVASWQDGLNGIEGLGGVRRLLISPQGNHLYAAAALDDAIAVFAIDAVDGTLTQTDLLEQGTAGIDGLNGISDLAFADGGNLLVAVAETNLSIALFRRSGTTGALLPLDVLLNDELLGTPGEDSLLGAVAVIEAGNELLVAARDGNRIGRFEVIQIDDPDPDVQPELTFAPAIDSAALGITLTGPYDLAWDPDRSRLYVASAAGVELLSLFDDTTTVVERYATGDFAVLNGLTRVVMGPSLRQLYTLGAEPGAELAAWGRERGSRCPIGGTGALGAQEVDIVAGGSLLYQLDASIQANATGTLDYTVSITNPALGEELNPSDNIDTDSDTLTPAPDLSVTKQLETAPVVAGLPVEWTIGAANAGLSDAPDAIITDLTPIFPADPGGILADSGTWSCDSNVPLSDPLDFIAEPDITSLALGPQGAYLYATSAANDSLLIYPLDGSGLPGAPIAIREGDVYPGVGDDEDLTVTGLAGASDVAVSADGLHVYVTGRAGNSLLVFAREDMGSPLDYLRSWTTTVPATSGSVPGLRGARSVVLSSDERFVFVAGSVSNAVAVFGRDSRTGALNFIERVVDGVGTIVPEFNVIQGAFRLHATTFGGDLYALAEDSEAISRFSQNPESGSLTFEQVLRQGGAIPAMSGALDLAAAPGDSHLYVLADSGVLRFVRGAAGELAYEDVFDGTGNFIEPTALVVDGAGSRAYVLDAGGGSPLVHVLRRDWADGSLEFWFTQPLAAGVPGAALQDRGNGRLLISGIGSGLQFFDEQALSRCSSPGETSDQILTTVDLGATGTADFEFGAVVHPSARGVLENTVSIDPAAGADPDGSDNVATVSAPIEVISDIGVVKTGPAEAVAGTQISYDVLVTNAGPSDALGIVVADVTPMEVGDVSWTCSASAGSTCPGSGTGDPSFAADVLVGGQLDIEVIGTIDPSFIGQMINVALLTPEPGSTDPTLDDQRSEVITNVVAVADVTVEKTTLTDPVIAGLPVEYQLVASNLGPSDAPDVELVDNLPNALADSTWTCTASGAATCPPSGTGDVAFSASLPAGSSVEILVTGQLDPSTTGTLANTFSAAVQQPATDPDSDNDSASVIDPISVVPDVILDLDDPLDPFDPAGPIGMPYVATLTNAGPSSATGLELELTTSAPITPQSPGCVNPTPTTIRCVTAPLDPGAVKVFSLVLFDLPAAPATLVIDGIASTTDDDPDLANNVDSTSTELLTGADLDVSLSNDRSWLSPDEDTTYTLTIFNIGSVDAPVVDVSMSVPIELLDAQWSCSGTGSSSCQASGSGDLIDVASVPSGETLTYILDATVDPAIDLSVPQSVVMSALAETSPPGSDINPTNNLATDIDEVRLVMFADSFESPVRTPQVLQRLDTACSEIVLGHPGRVNGVILEGRANGGQRLFWIESSVRGDRVWLQAIALGDRAPQLSGWLDWPTGETSIRIDRRDLRIELPGSIDWTPRADLQAPVDLIVLPERRSVDGRSAMMTVGSCSAGDDR